MRVFRFITAAILLVLCASAANAATELVVLDGQLMRANNVDVGGTLYDVEFVKGSCITLFTGCDSADDFLFTDPTLVMQAVDTLDTFIYAAELPSGCPSPPTTCITHTPWRLTSNSLGDFFVDVRSNFWGFQNILIAEDPTTTFQHGPYARWSVASVPIPSSVWLMGSGLLGLIGLGGGKGTFPPQVTSYPTNPLSDIRKV